MCVGGSNDNSHICGTCCFQIGVYHKRSGFVAPVPGVKSCFEYRVSYLLTLEDISELNLKPGKSKRTEKIGQKLKNYSDYGKTVIKQSGI